jgi:hypothetical protein
VTDGLPLAFLIWVTAHVEATGLAEEAWTPEALRVLHLPGEGTEARLVWTGDGPRLAASWLSARSVPVPTDG